MRRSSPQEMTGLIKPLGALFVALFCLLWWLVRVAGDSEEALLIHCAAGFQRPMTELAQRFEEEHGVQINLQFGGSGALLSQLKVMGGDLYFPADESYLTGLRDEGLLNQSAQLGWVEAGLVVPQGNPKQLGSLHDLVSSSVRLSLADQSASIGRHVREVLLSLGHWEAVRKKIVVTKPTVSHVVEDVAIGAADATIAWRAVAEQFSEVEWVALPEFSRRKQAASIGILKGSRKTENAELFLNYLSNPEHGLLVFSQMGYETVE